MNHPVYRAAELMVRAWVRLYLVGLPPQARSQRTAEIASDLHEYRRYVEERGGSPTAAALRLLVRCMAGVFDDLFWRSEAKSALGGTSMSRRMRGPGLRFVGATVAIGLVFATVLAILGEPILGLVVGIALASGLALYLKTDSAAYRLGGGVALAAVFFLVIGASSLGILGADGGQPADLMYIGVFAVGIVGAIIARFRPEGMARALFATALTQALVAVIALAAGAMYPSWWKAATGMQHPNPVYEIVGLNGMFVAMFLGSALLFWTAARGNTSAGATPKA